jgi:predicted dehydrogenase
MGRHEERGRSSSEKYGLEYSQDLETVLSRDDVHAVIVTCETSHHADVIEAACAHGKHILCQKPMATTREDCDRIIKAVDDSAVHFQMAFQMRCDPLNQKIKEWVESGAVGRISSLRRRHCINFLFNSDLPNSAAAWHISPERMLACSSTTRCTPPIYVLAAGKAAQRDGRNRQHR